MKGNTWKILVCGDREWSDDHRIIESELNGLNYQYIIQQCGNIILIHGDCRGADRIAGNHGRSLGWKVMPFPADWDKHGKAAGPIRNRQMLDEKPDLVIAFHSNLKKSKGTIDTVMEANRRGIEVVIIPVYKAE